MLAVSSILLTPKSCGCVSGALFRALYQTSPASYMDQSRARPTPPHLRPRAVISTFLPILPAYAAGHQVPFGRLLMDHVRERCVLLRACWHVKLSQPELAALESSNSSATSVAPAVAAPARGCAAEGCGSVGGRAMAEASGQASCEAAGGEGPCDNSITYGRTVTIVCDGQVRWGWHIASS